MLEWDLDRRERDVVRVKEKRKNKYKTENRRTKNWRQLEQKRIEEKMRIGTEEENEGEEPRILKRILNREERGSTETGSTDGVEL